jgi:hypothetical protein
MIIGAGTKFNVVRGGGEFKFKLGEVWDLVDGGAGLGLELRKMNKRGGSIRLLNGYQIARQEMDAGRLQIIGEA